MDFELWIMEAYQHWLFVKLTFVRPSFTPLLRFQPVTPYCFMAINSFPIDRCDNYVVILLDFAYPDAFMY